MSDAIHWTENQIAHAIACELDEAFSKHGKEPWSRHEFYSILLEEVDEIWDSIKKDDPIECVEREAIQVAAVVFRFMMTHTYRKP